MHNILFVESSAKKNKKTSSEQQFCGQKYIVNEGGQGRRARLVKAGRKVTAMQITKAVSRRAWKHNTSNL